MYLYAYDVYAYIHIWIFMSVWWCFHYCPLLCVCVCVFMCSCAHVYACGASQPHVSFLRGCPPWFSNQGLSLTWSLFSRLASWWVIEILLSLSQVLTFQTHAAWLFEGCWACNSGLYVCVFSTLLTEPSPQPGKRTFCTPQLGLTTTHF